MQTQKTTVETGEIFVEKVTELIVPTLQEVEESLVKVNLAQVQLTQQLEELKREVSEFATRVEQIEVKAPIPDTANIEVLIIRWHQKIINTLEAFPKKHSVRILLFPEHHTVEYLKTLWKSAFIWLLGITITLSLYSLGSKWLDLYIISNRYKSAWETIYLHQNQKGKKMMNQELNRQ